MKALFVNVPVYDFSAFDLWSKPYGFLFIVDLLMKNGWDIGFFDFMDRNHSFYDGKRTDRKYGCGHYHAEFVNKPEVYRNVPKRYKRFGLPQEIFLRFLQDSGKIDMIFITCAMTYWYTGVKEVIDTCRKFTDAPVVIGGTYATFCPEHAKKLGADIVFQGSDIRNFVSLFNKNTGFKLRYFENLKPLWRVYEKLSYLVVRTSYGCPFSCWYCGIKKLQPEYRLRRKEDVVDEIEENFEKYKFKDIAFYDDALLFDFEHLAAIIEKIAGMKKINFHTPNGIHPKFINSQVASFLKKYGFKTIRLSVETFDEKRQKESSFKLCFADFEKAMKYLVDAGFSKNEIGAYILAGLPGQKFEDVVETIKILKNYPCKVKLAEYSPIPETPDFEISRRINPDLPLDEPLYHNNSIFPLWGFEGKWEKIEWLKLFAQT